MEKNMPRNTSTNSGRSCYKKLFILGILLAGIVTISYFWNLRSSNTILRGQINSEILRRAEESKRVEAMSSHLKLCEEEGERGKKLMQEKESTNEKLVDEDVKLKRSLDDITLNLEKLETSHQELERVNKQTEEDAKKSKADADTITDELTQCKDENAKLSETKTCDHEVKGAINDEKQKIAEAVQKILGNKALHTLISEGIFNEITFHRVSPTQEAINSHKALDTNNLHVGEENVAQREHPSKVKQEPIVQQFVNEQRKEHLKDTSRGVGQTQPPKQQEQPRDQNEHQDQEQERHDGHDVEDEVKHQQDTAVHGQVPDNAEGKNTHDNPDEGKGGDENAPDGPLNDEGKGGDDENAPDDPIHDHDAADNNMEPHHILVEQ